MSAANAFCCRKRLRQEAPHRSFQALAKIAVVLKSPRREIPRRYACLRQAVRNDGFEDCLRRAEMFLHPAMATLARIKLRLHGQGITSRNSGTRLVLSLAMLSAGFEGVFLLRGFKAGVFSVAKERRGIHLIAELAHVSIGTVDRALHGRAGINDATRQRILQIARQVGYAPNLAARALSVAKANTKIGVCVPREIHFFYDQLWNGILEEEIGRAS